MICAHLFRFYVFCCVIFGLSQAPSVFTRVMQCAHEVTRAQDYDLTFMIDDATATDESQACVARCAGAFVAEEAALGFVDSFDKCRLWPFETKLARAQQGLYILSPQNGLIHLTKLHVGLSCEKSMGTTICKRIKNST